MASGTNICSHLSAESSTLLQSEKVSQQSDHVSAGFGSSVDSAARHLRPSKSSFPEEQNLEPELQNNSKTRKLKNISNSSKSFLPFGMRENKCIETKIITHP